MHLCFIYLLIFLVVCYVHILGPRSNKLDPRSIKYVFLGYSHTQKGYQCYSSTLCRHFISADVTFDESQSYFSPSVANDNSPPYLPLLPHMSPTKSPQNHSKCIVVGRNLQHRLLPHLVIRLLILALFQLFCTKLSVLVPLILSLNLSLMVTCLHLSMLLPHPWILLLFLSLSRGYVHL